MLSTALLSGILGFLLLVATTFVWFRRAGQVAIPNNRAAFLLGWIGVGADAIAV